MHVARTKPYALLRLGLGLLIIFTVAWQFDVSTSRFHADPFNFFSYFTILSNLFVAGVFIASALVYLTGKTSNTALECVRGAATVYMITTGIVYALLLAQYTLNVTEPWVNFVLHRMMPVIVVLDWLIAPPRMRLRRAVWWSWLSFPIVYLIYTLIRGPIVDWYPYPFLDPNRSGGYARVAVYSIGVAVFMSLLLLFVGWSGNVRIKKKA